MTRTDEQMKDANMTQTQMTQVKRTQAQMTAAQMMNAQTTKAHMAGCNPRFWLILKSRLEFRLDGMTLCANEKNVASTNVYAWSQNQASIGRKIESQVTGRDFMQHFTNLTSIT